MVYKNTNAWLCSFYLFWKQVELFCRTGPSDLHFKHSEYLVRKSQYVYIVQFCNLFVVRFCSIPHTSNGVSKWFSSPLFPDSL